MPFKKSVRPPLDENYENIESPIDRSNVFVVRFFWRCFSRKYLYTRLFWYLYSIRRDKLDIDSETSDVT